MGHGRRDLLKLAALTTLVGCAHVPLQPSQASPRERKTTMPFQPLLTLRLMTAATQDIGAVPYGQRVTFPIIGGSFEGARLRGKVLYGGDDWTVKRPDEIGRASCRERVEVWGG